MRLASCALVAGLLAAAGPAAAQTSSLCHPVSPTRPVDVQMHDGQSVRGTLLCLTNDDVVLAADGGTVTAPLSNVRRIRSRPDPVWDGGAMGAAIPLILFAIFCDGYCGSSMVLRTTAAYGLVGLTLDGLQTNTKTIYTGRPRPAIGWTVRF